MWWEVELQTLRQSNKGLRQWQTVHRECSGHPFCVDDGTGEALIYPQGAEVRAGEGVSEETKGFGVPERYAGFMESRALGIRHIWSVGPMCFRERVLEKGRAVFVLGRAEPRAGVVDEQARKAIGTDAVGSDSVRTNDGRCMAVVRKGRRDPALLISDMSEKSKSIEYGLKTFGGLAGGLLLVLFGLWCLMELAKSGALQLPR